MTGEQPESALTRRYSSDECEGLPIVLNPPIRIEHEILIRQRPSINNKNIKPDLSSTIIIPESGRY